MELADAVTLAGATILVNILVEALKRALSWGADTVSRFGPLVAIVLGIIVVVVLSAAQGLVTPDNWPQAVASAMITGALAGAAASGIYAGGKVVALEASRTPQDAPGTPDDPGADQGALDDGDG